jgi:hypothetical protein
LLSSKGSTWMKWSLVGLCIVVTGMGSAQAASTAECRGDCFSFEYPAGWVEMTGENFQKIVQANPEMRRFLADIDMSALEVMVVKPVSEGDLAPNITVTVENGWGSVNKAEAKKAGAELVRFMRKAGMQMRVVHTGVVDVDGHDAIRVELVGTTPAHPDEIRQMATLVPAGGRVYSMWCTAPADEYALHKPRFDATVASLEVEGLFGRVKGIAVVFALICGVVAVVGYLVRKSRRRREAALAHEPFGAGPVGATEFPSAEQEPPAFPQ